MHARCPSRFATLDMPASRLCIATLLFCTLPARALAADTPKPANAAITVNVAGSDWPEFRGPDGQGHSLAVGLPVSWSENDNIAWKAELPGHGWSTPVIKGQQIW